MDYVKKSVSAQEAAKIVKSGDWVDYGFGGGFPELMDRALAVRRDELENVKIRGGLVIAPRIEVMECDPERTTFFYHSWHLGDYERKMSAKGLVDFMPVALRFLPTLYRQHIRTDVAFVPFKRRKGFCVH